MTTRIHLQLHSTVSASLEYKAGTSFDEKREAYAKAKEQLISRESDDLRHIYSFGYGPMYLPCYLHGHVVRRFQRWFNLGAAASEGLAEPGPMELLNSEQLATLARKSFHTDRSVKDLLADMRPDYIGGYGGTFLGTTPSGRFGSLDPYGDFNT